MNANKKGTVNLISSLLYKLVTIAIGIILPKLFITTYGSAINGLQSSVGQIFTYLGLLEGGIGAATLQSLFAPVAKNDTKKANEYLSATSYYYNKIGVVYFIALFVIGLIYSLTVKIEGYSWVFIFLYCIFAGSSGINYFYLAKLKLLMSASGDEYIIMTLTMVTFMLTSIVKIVLIGFGVNIVFLQIGYLLLNLLITFVYYRVAQKKYPWISFHEKPDFSCVEQKNSVLVHRVSSLIFQNIDVLLLTFMCDLKVVSIYSIYKLVVSTITTIVGSMGESVNFIFGQTYNTDESEKKEKYCRMIDVFNVYYSAISFAFFSVMCLLIIPFLKLYTEGMDQSYIYEALPLLFITIEILTVGREAMMRTIEVAGHFKKTQWRAVAESAINLTFSVIAIIVCKQYFGLIGGLYGALIGTIAAMLYRTIDINIYANKKILHRSCFKTFWIMIINSITLLLSLFIIKPLIPPCDSYISFVLIGLCVTPVVLLISLALQSVFNRKEAKVFVSVVKRRLKK